MLPWVYQIASHPRVLDAVEGIAVRYIAREVVQKGAERQIVQLVRGRDEYGRFEIVPAPADAVSAAEIRKEADRRITRNFLPEVKRS